MPVPGQTSPMPAEFSAFTFPPPPTRPGHIVLNRYFLYETKTRFFIVGTNAPAGTRFRVLKIDLTTAPDELSITEDETVYSKSEVDDLLEMIANGNKSTGGDAQDCKLNNTDLKAGQELGRGTVPANVQMVDLTKNFYFSYSNDILRTLQAHMTRLCTLPPRPVKTSPAMSSSTSPSAGSYHSSIFTRQRWHQQKWMRKQTEKQI
ncbi:phosphatidylinositol-3,5-bisphosphate 5-phosphatase [Podila minutissima]|nr:phosphatidylinositol-3,5-bisphosphate 5-phosphatase [Podila minutissima]